MAQDIITEPERRRMEGMGTPGIRARATVDTDAAGTMAAGAMGVVGMGVGDIEATPNWQLIQRLAEK
jgi:hypothetical protein